MVKILAHSGECVQNVVRVYLNWPLETEQIIMNNKYVLDNWFP